MFYMLQSSTAHAEVKRLNKLLAALEAASAGDASALLVDMENGTGASSSTGTGAAFSASTRYAATTAAAIRQRQPNNAAASAAGDVARVNITEVRLQLQRQLKQAVRHSGPFA